MKLSKVALRRYRSIEDLEEFSIEEGVTCLVGKNESGKTGVLQALLKSNPIDSSSFDISMDYPSRLSGERRKVTGPILVSSLTYALDQSDVQAVDSELGAGALTSTEVVVDTGYRYSGTEWQVEIDQDVVLNHIRGGIDLPSQAQSGLDSVSSLRELVEYLRELAEPNSGATAALQKISNWPGSDPTDAAISILDSRRPKFVYFGEYDAIPGQIDISDLITRRTAKKLDRSEQAFLSLLDIADVRLEDFAKPDSHDHLVRAIEDASNSITDEVFTYWSQNRDLRVALSYMSAPNPGIQIRVFNNKHQVSVPFNERSHGFVWFFSFLAYFSGLEEAANSPVVLLLDEPGLSLHAKAQADLLRFIEERLAPQHQVIYTTHSPFMIDSRALERVRTVQDEEQGGTRVSQDVLTADSDTVFPLMAALGMDLTQTLWVGSDILLVEGPSDVVYLTYLSRYLEEQGQNGLDTRWTITPAGGITKLPSFLSIFGSNRINVAVLTDSSDADAATIARLRQLGRLGYGGVVRIGDALGRTEADIEDLLGTDFYLALVNKAYAGELHGKSITSADLPSGDRLLKRVQTYFTQTGTNKGNFNHFAPAGVLLRGEVPPHTQPDDSSIAATATIITKINHMIVN